MSLWQRFNFFLLSIYIYFFFVWNIFVFYLNNQDYNGYPYCTYTSNMYITVQYLRVYCKGTRRGLSILCFEHCGKRIFSLKNIPDACPVCNLLITQCDLKIPPFAVPSPFKKAVDFPCSIVIKPTKGTFF